MNKDILIPIGSIIAVLAIGFFGLRDIGNTMGKSMANIASIKEKHKAKQATAEQPEVTV